MNKFVVKDFTYRGHHFDEFSIDITKNEDGSKKSAQTLHAEWLIALDRAVDDMDADPNTESQK